MRATFCFLVCGWLAACGGSATTSSTTPARGTDRETTTSSAGTDSSAPVVPLLRDGRRPTPNESREIDRLVTITAETRGLAVARPIEVRIARSEVVAAHLIASIEDEDLVEMVDLYVALGMIAPGTDLVAILSRVVGEQVVGFYDPDLDVLVIREDVMEGLARTGALDPEALITIVHEVIHALQGQHLDLRARMDADQEIDVTDAYQALIEGDATLGMLLVAARLRRLPIDEILASMPVDLEGAIALSSPEESNPAFPTAELGSSPPILRIGLIAPYISGLAFCASLYRDGGIAAIDAAHHRLPATTEQVMHPDKYRSREAADAIDLGSVPELAAAGFEAVSEHTLGELELGIYLGKGSALEFDTAASTGWGGDRVRVLRRGAALSAVLVASFDTEADAIEAERAIGRSTDAGRTFERTGRLLLATHGLDGAALEAIRIRARALAAALPGRNR